MNAELNFNAAIEYLFGHIKGVTQKKVAEETGLKQPEVSMIKTGERRGTPEQRALLRKFFDLTEAEIAILGDAIASGMDPIGHPKISLSQAKMILKRFFDESRDGLQSKKVENADNQNSLSEKITKYTNPLVIKHQELITRFPDPEKALELNSLAVYLSELEPKEIDKAIEYLKERITFNEVLKGINKPPDKKASNGEH